MGGSRDSEGNHRVSGGLYPAFVPSVGRKKICVSCSPFVRHFEYRIAEPVGSDQGAIFPTSFY